MKVTRDEIVDFLCEFWRAAQRPGSQASAAERKISNYLRQLSGARQKFLISDADPSPTKWRGPAGAFSPSRRALWFNRAALGVWLGPNKKRGDADHMLEFYDGKEFGRHLSTFIDSARLDMWWDERVTANKWLTIECGSVVVNGVSDAIFWFGIRTAKEIEATIAAYPDVFRLRIAGRLGRMLRAFNGKQRALLLEQRVVSVETDGPVPSDIVQAARKRTGQRETVTVARTAAEIAVALGSDNFAAGISHPAIADTDAPEKAILRLRGRAGSGKTSAVRDLLLRSHHVAVVLNTGYTEAQHSEVENLLRRVAAEGRRPVLVIEDLDNRDTSLPWLRDVPTIITYRTEAEVAVRQRYSFAFTARDGTEIDLDAVPDEAMTTFFEAIIRAAAPGLGLRPNEYDPEREVQLLSSMIVQWDALPRTLVTVLCAAQGGVLHRSIFQPTALLDRRWARAFNALDDDYRAIVTALALMCEFHIRPLDETLLYACTRALRAMEQDDFHARLRRTAYEGWCSIATDGTISAREAHLRPEVIGLWDSASRSKSLLKFADWVFCDERVLPRNWRRHILKGIYLLYLREQEVPRAAVFAGYWADHEPDVIALTAAAFAYQWSDDVTKARQYALPIAHVYRAFNGDMKQIKALGDEFKELYHFHNEINVSMPQDPNNPVLYRVYDMRLLPSLRTKQKARARKSNTHRSGSTKRGR